MRIGTMAAAGLLVLMQGAAIAPRPAGSVSELMRLIIYPTSDAVFYISTRTPKTEAGWNELEAKTLALAESANLLMLPGLARDRDRWLAESQLMLEAGTAAFKAAKAKDVEGLKAVNETLLESCVACHRDYRRNYGRGRP
jgi:hypothetical protein